MSAYSLGGGEIADSLKHAAGAEAQSAVDEFAETAGNKVKSAAEWAFNKITGGAPPKRRRSAVAAKRKKGESDSDDVGKTGRFYNIIALDPKKDVKLVKFYGACPSAAARKVGNEVFRKTGTKRFHVIMRLAHPSKHSRTLYKYLVEIRDVKNPSARFRAKVKGGFKTAAGETIKDPVKLVKIVASSDLPVYGHVAEDGTIEKGAGDGTFVVRRDPSKNTLVMVAAKPPRKVRDIPVSITESEPVATRETLTDAELAKYDVTGGAKAKAVPKKKKMATKAPSKA